LLVAVTTMSRGRTIIATLVVLVAGFVLWRFLARGEPGPERHGRPDSSIGSSSLTEGSAAETRGGKVPNEALVPAAEPRSATPAVAAARTVESANPAVSAAPREDGTTCDDGDPCTFRDRIRDGVCSGQPLHCDDENPLTVDSCTGDGCAHALVPGAFGSPPAVDR